MSYYYNYKIGYELDGQLYPLGPYDCNGKLHDVVSRSRSFASDLHRDFMPVPDKMISEALRKQFEYTDWDGKAHVDVKYLPLDELPDGDFVKHGYYLIDDVQAYEQDHDLDDVFYNHLSPTVYAARAEQEARFGKPGPQLDDAGEQYIPYAASDFMYYAFPDDRCKEYEAFLIRETAFMLSDYGDLPADAKLVVLETEG